MAMSYAMLARYLERADEISRLPGLPAPILRLHGERLAPVASAFRAATAALVEAEASAAKERREAGSAIARIVAPYKLARSIVRAREKSLSLPKTLEALPTDTDRKIAIAELLSRIERSKGEAWADELLADEFARLAPEAIREVDESVHASSARKRAVDARAAAFGPAYEELLGFKAAVLAGMGSASPAYQRLLLRGRAGGEEEAPEAPAEADVETA